MTMTVEALKAGIEFGRAWINTCKENGEDVPEWVYTRMFELYEELMKKGE